MVRKKKASVARTLMKNTLAGWNGPGPGGCPCGWNFSSPTASSGELSLGSKGTRPPSCFSRIGGVGEWVGSVTGQQEASGRSGHGPFIPS